MNKATLKDLICELWLRERNAGSIIWETHDGKKIPINKMSNEHLVNAINRLEEIEEIESNLGSESDLY